VFVTVTNFLPLLLDAREILGTFQRGCELSRNVSRHFGSGALGSGLGQTNTAMATTSVNANRVRVVKVRLFICFAERSKRSRQLQNRSVNSAGYGSSFHWSFFDYLGLVGKAPYVLTASTTRLPTSSISVLSTTNSNELV